MQHFQKVLGAAGAVAALSLVAVGNAHADAYAVSKNEVSNFGINLNGDIPELVDPSATSSASANMAGVSGISGSRSDTAPDVPVQSLGNPTRGENNFSSVGQTGEYSHGDSVVRSSDLIGGNGSAANVAEGFITGDDNTSQSSGSFQWTRGFTIEDGGSGSLDFAFDADPLLDAEVTPEEGNNASANLTFRIGIAQADTGDTVFRWRPDGEEGGILGGTEISDMRDLNESITANPSNPNPELFDPDPGSFEASTDSLGPGTYSLTAAFGQEEVANRSAVAPEAPPQQAPAPAPLALLAVGLIGLQAMRWRWA